MTGHLLVFGHGFSAGALATRLLSQGWAVTGTTRSAERAEVIKSTGVSPVIWPGNDMKVHLEQATHLLISAAPDEAGDPVLREIHDQLSKQSFEWVGYLSTTGVYGDHAGGWVDEETALTPSTKRGKLRVMAEKQWQNLAVQTGWPLNIFRLAGIYGPGRGPFSKVRKGTARRIIKQGQVFSRIHVEDIAQVLEASISKGGDGRIYNLCDDDPAPPQDVIAFAAELLDLPVPEAVDFETTDMSPMARSFYAESKRVRNDRIKDELGVVLKYPDYRTGLKALLDAQS